MSESTVRHDDLANAIRALSMDAVEAANSGHPGLPLGMADVATVLFTRHLKLDVTGGSAAGLRTAWLVRRIEDPEKALREHTGPAPSYVIRDLAEVPALLL